MNTLADDYVSSYSFSGVLIVLRCGSLKVPFSPFTGDYFLGFDPASSTCFTGLQDLSLPHISLS